MLQITKREMLVLLKRMSAGVQAAANQFCLAYDWPVRKLLSVT